MVLNKINPNETLRTSYPKINAAIDAADRADNNASEAKSLANQALANSESTQEQLDQIVIEGDSSVEAAQARVDAKGNPHTTLKERLDYEHNELSSQLAQKAKIILSDKEPSDVDDETFWYEDRGESPINFSPDGGVSVANAAVSDTEPSDTDNLWFDVE